MPPPTTESVDVLQLRRGGGGAPISGGWRETTLYSFTGGADGSEPFLNSVTLDVSGNLFGTVTEGGDLSCTINGTVGCGVAYKITP